MKKRGLRAIDGFRQKLFIPDYKTFVSIGQVKSKIGKTFVNDDILEENLSGFMKLSLVLVSIIKKIQVNSNSQKYILFRIYIYFAKYCLAIEIDEKGHTDRDLAFEQKRQGALGTKLNCTFIRINISRENFDVNYEASRIQTFISQFKDNKNEELKDELEKLKLQLAYLSVKNSEVNDKK